MATRKHPLATKATETHGALPYLPSICIGLLTALNLVRLPLPWFEVANPLFILIGIIYFTLWQPIYVRYSVLLICGLFYDASQLSYFGSYAMMFMMIRLISGEIRHRLGFIEQWLKSWCMFIALATLFFMMEASVIYVTTGDYIFNRAVMIRIMLTIMLYPLLAACFTSIIMWLQKRR